MKDAYRLIAAIFLLAFAALASAQLPVVTPDSKDTLTFLQTSLASQNGLRYNDGNCKEESGSACYHHAVEYEVLVAGQTLMLDQNLATLVYSFRGARSSKAPQSPASTLPQTAEVRIELSEVKPDDIFVEPNTVKWCEGQTAGQFNCHVATTVPKTWFVKIQAGRFVTRTPPERKSRPAIIGSFADEDVARRVARAYSHLLECFRTNVLPPPFSQ